MVVLQLVLTVIHNRHDYIVYDEAGREVEYIEELTLHLLSEFYNSVDLKNQRMCNALLDFFFIEQFT